MPATLWCYSVCSSLESNQVGMKYGSENEEEEVVRRREGTTASLMTAPIVRNSVGGTQNGSFGGEL